jgi:hypothetical protein
MTVSACALAEARNSSIQLAGCCRTRPPERPPRHVLHGIDSLPRGYHYRVLAVGDSLDGHNPNSMQHVQAANHGRDRRKSHCK